MQITLPSLWPQQEDVRDRTRISLAKHRRSIICLPPGGGKTRVAKWILGASLNREPGEQASGKSLFAVHRRGLVDNAVASFEEDPGLPHGIIMSGSDTSYGSRIQVASIDSLLSWFIDNDKYYPDITFDLIIFDECVSGDAVIETEIGTMRLDDVPKRNPISVKTWSNGKGVHFSKILDWTFKGVRDTMVIHTNAGKVQCTPDHKIYTRRGWLQAQFINPSDEILACVDVGGGHVMEHSSRGDARIRPQKQHLRKHGKSFTRMLRYVSAAAERKYAQLLLQWISGFRQVCQRDTTDMLTDTLSARLIKRWNLLLSNDRQYLEPSSETHRSSTHIKQQNILDCRAHIATNSLLGRSTKLTSYIALTPRHVSHAMMDMAICQFAQSRPAIHVLRQYMTLLEETVKSKYHENGLMELATLVSHGGSAMTDLEEPNHYSSIQKVSRKRKTNLSQAGSVTTSVQQRYTKTKRNTSILSESQAGLKLKSESEYHNTCQNVCDTSWSRVTKIVHAKPSAVYDIEVEGSHCFFANGILVHNCHSHGNKFARFLKYHDAKREELGLHKAYVIGLSATPQAKGLSDVYGEIVNGPSTQWLMDNGYLSPFRYFRATQGKLGLLVKRGNEFTKDSEAMAMDGLAGDLVRDWKQYAEGRPTVGFFPRRSHARDAMAQLEATGIRVAYVDGNTPDDERRQIFRDLNKNYIDYLCNVQVVERGTDIPNIQCVQLCVAIGSVVRYRQMIGRGSRTHDGKADCCVARGTMILTDRGEIPIQEVLITDRIWDGVEFCYHDGPCCTGVKDVIQWEDITITPDHKVLTNEGWKEAQEAKSGEWRPTIGGMGRTPIRTTDDSNPHYPRKRSKPRSRSRLFALRKERLETFLQNISQAASWMRTLYAEIWTALPRMDMATSPASTAAMPVSTKRGISSLRWAWNRIQVFIHIRRCMLDSEKSWASTKQIMDNRSNRQRWSLRARKSTMGDVANSVKKSRICMEGETSANISIHNLRRHASIESPQAGINSEANSDSMAIEVWDIRNVGPRNRYCANGIIVANCILDHGGNILRHGFFEDDPQWSLDITTKDPGRVNARPTIECPKCQAIYRGGKCRYCGYEPTPRERKSQGLEFDGRELKEVIREDVKSKSHSPEKLMISALYMAGKSGRTWKQAVGIFMSKCEKQGQRHRVPVTITVAGRKYRMLPYGDPNGGRRVSVLYPFTSGGKHGGDYLVEDSSDTYDPVLF